MVIDFLMFTSRPSARQWSLISYVTLRSSVRQWSSISLHQNPLRGNDHCFLMSHWGPLRGNGHRSLYIKTFCEAMVIDYLCHIEAFYEAMVIDLFTSRPSPRQWSLISYVTSRPSPRQWSSISLHQDPLRGNGNWFLMSHPGLLQGNGHRSLYIMTFYEAMVIDFLCHVEALCEAMVIDLFTSRPCARQWSLISLSNWDPLRGNGHRIFRYRPSPRDWSNLFFKKSKLKKDFLFGSRPSIW